MTALAKIPTVPATFETWLQTGRQLVDQRREIDWKLGDWLADGRRQFGEQAEFDFLADALGLAPQRLKQAEKLAIAFPAPLRAQDVPVEVYAQIERLPQDKRLETLQRASREHWGEKQAREAVTIIRQQTAMFEDEDSETRLAVEIIRAWNRAPAESRRYFWELAERAGFGAINEDEAGGDDA